MRADEEVPDAAPAAGATGAAGGGCRARRRRGRRQRKRRAGGDAIRSKVLETSRSNSASAVSTRTFQREYRILLHHRES